MITVSKDDISKDLARRAYEGTSFDPEKRGERDRLDYVNTMTSIIEEFTALANTEEKKAIIKAELERLKQGYIKRITDLLHSHSRIMSTMITGPANFPVRTMEKRNASYYRKTEEFNTWLKKAKASIYKKLKQQDVKDRGGELAIAKQELAQAVKNHEMMKAVNKIVKKKSLSDEDKKRRLKDELNLHQETILNIFAPDYMGRIGFAGFELTNSNARIKRLQARVSELEQRESSAGIEVLRTGDGWQLFDNKDINRLQFIFDEKPEYETRQVLKKNGFRWSPKNNAWQRQTTGNAIFSTKNVVLPYFMKEV